MLEDVQEFQNEMGETGAGITREDEINMDQENPFTNKWGTLALNFVTQPHR